MMLALVFLLRVLLPLPGSLPAGGSTPKKTVPVPRNLRFWGSHQVLTEPLLALPEERGGLPRSYF